MSKELVEEIMALEAKSEQQLHQAQQDAEHMVRKAREKAMLLIQQAEHSLDTERQQLIAAHDKTVHSQREQARQQAQAEAQTLAKSVTNKMETVASFVTGRFAEYVRNDVS